MSVLPQCFADPALGEFVLAHDALGVDPQQHVHPVPCPLRHLSGVDTAVQPRGQAGMPEVIRTPRERRGLLGRGQGYLARLYPGSPVGDREQLATPHATEEAAVGGRAELGKMLTKQPGQLRVGQHDAAIALGPVLQLSSFPRAPIVGPLAARIRRCAANVQLAPVLVVKRVEPLPAVLIPNLWRQDQVVRREVDRFLSTWLDTLGAVHLSARIGFVSSRPSSTA